MGLFIKSLPVTPPRQQPAEQENKNQKTHLLARTFMKTRRQGGIHESLSLDVVLD